MAHTEVIFIQVFAYLGPTHLHYQGKNEESGKNVGNLSRLDERAAPKPPGVLLGEFGVALPAPFVAFLNKLRRRLSLTRIPNLLRQLIPATCNLCN